MPLVVGTVLHTKKLLVFFRGKHSREIILNQAPITNNQIPNGCDKGCLTDLCIGGWLMVMIF